MRVGQNDKILAGFEAFRLGARESYRMTIIVGLDRHSADEVARRGLTGNSLVVLKGIGGHSTVAMRAQPVNRPEAYFRIAVIMTFAGGPQGVASTCVLACSNRWGGPALR
jgi:hypothetical protein